MAKKIKSYSEVELIEMFGLTRLSGNSKHPLLAKWTDTTTTLTVAETALFDQIYTNAAENIIGWQEEDLKMLFIAPILLLSTITNTKRYLTFFERTIEDTVDGHFLKTKTDFMIATGTVGIFKAPYFHFQEYRAVNSSPYGEIRRGLGDAMGQLLEAMLIAQQKTKMISRCTAAR